jgi:transposase
VDESGFYVLPAAVRTYAPRGQTLVLRARYSRDHLSVISAITPDGRLVVHAQEQPLCGPDVVAFLRQLLRLIPGRLLVLWDGASIHRNRDMKHFLATGAAARLHLEQLPAYAPELNPDEGVWHHLKRVELGNRCCQDLAELRWELGLAVRRLRRKAHVIRGCFAQCKFTPSESS